MRIPPVAPSYLSVPDERQQRRATIQAFYAIDLKILSGYNENVTQRQAICTRVAVYSVSTLPVKM